MDRPLTSFAAQDLTSQIGTSNQAHDPRPCRPRPYSPREAQSRVVDSTREARNPRGDRNLRNQIEVTPQPWTAVSQRASVSTREALVLTNGQNQKDLNPGRLLRATEGTGLIVRARNTLKTIFRSAPGHPAGV